MRFVGWLIVLAVLGHTGYAALLAFWEYSRVAAAVDLALDAQRRRAGTDDPTVRLQEAVLQAAREHRIPLDTRDVRVAERDDALTVSVTWSRPVLVLYGEPAVAIPLRVQRSAAAPGAR